MLDIGINGNLKAFGKVIGHANNKNNATSAEVIEEDMKIASEMAANMNVGSDSIIDSVNSMTRGAEYLDKVWKGDTKETFMDELAYLGKLIERNSKDLEKLGQTIEARNKITEEQKNEDYKEAEVLYNQSNI